MVYRSLSLDELATAAATDFVRELPANSSKRPTLLCTGTANSSSRPAPSSLGLYKIVFHFEAFVHESIILLPPPPHLILLHYYYDTPRPLVCMPYTIQYWRWQSRIWAKSSLHTHRRRGTFERC